MLNKTLKLNKIETTLANRTFAEMYPKERLAALLRSPFLGDFDVKNYCHVSAKQYHENEKQQLTALLTTTYNEKEKVFEVKYKQAKSGYGRVFPQKSLGLTSMRKNIRNALIKGVYYDFDLSNAHPTIVLEVCEKHNLPCKYVREYVNNREEVLGNIMSHYEVNRNKAKKLMLRLMFTGTVLGWKIEEKVNKKDDLPYLENFTKELYAIAQGIRPENENMYKTCRDSKRKKAKKSAPAANKRQRISEDAFLKAIDTVNKRKAKKTNEEELNDIFGTDTEDESQSDNNTKKNIDPFEGEYLGSLLATYMQTLEEQILAIVMEAVEMETSLTIVKGVSHPVSTYEFDGIKLLHENVEEYGGKEKVIEFLNRVTEERTGFHMSWEEKEIETKYDLTPYM
ncbi:MAG: hypothetical protein EOO46_21370, partial [Flavobacterium sp.]